MTALQEHTGPLSTQAHGAAGGRHAALVQVEFSQTLPVLLFELLEHALLLLTFSVMNILLPQDEEEGGTSSHAKDDSQNPPQSDAVSLLPEKRIVVQPSEKVTETLFGRLELDQVVVEHQLSYACDAVSKPQHLLRLLDAFGSFPADEVADDVGQGLDRGVEVLVGGLQVQLGSIERTHDPHCSGDVIIMRPEGKWNCVGALVDHFLRVVPVGNDKLLKCLK